MSQLQKTREKRLRECEKVLAEHMEEFVRVGVALKEIRDDRLYKAAGYSSFERYAKEKWDLSERYANNIIKSSEYRLQIPSSTGAVKGKTDSPMWTERAVRELHRLESPTLGKAIAAKVVQECAENGKPLTGPLVRKHVDEHLGVKTKRPKGGSKNEKKDEPKFFEVVAKWAGELQFMTRRIEEVPGDGLELFAEEYPATAKDLVKAIEGLEKALQKVWRHLP